MENIYLLADTEVYYDNAALQDGTALTTATVTFEVLTPAGVSLSPAVTGTASHVSGGDYTGVIESTTATTVTFTDGAAYLIAWTFTQGSYNDYRRKPARACYRGEA